MQLGDLKVIATGAARGMGAHFARQPHAACAAVATASSAFFVLDVDGGLGL